MFSSPFMLSCLFLKEVCAFNSTFTRTGCESVDELSLPQTKIPTRPKHTSDPKGKDPFFRKIDSGSMFILRVSGCIYIYSDCNMNSPTSCCTYTTYCILYIYIIYSYTLVARGAFPSSHLFKGIVGRCQKDGQVSHDFCDQDHISSKQTFEYQIIGLISTEVHPHNITAPHG